MPPIINHFSLQNERPNHPATAPKMSFPREALSIALKEEEGRARLLQGGREANYGQYSRPGWLGLLTFPAVPVGISLHCERTHGQRTICPLFLCTLTVSLPFDPYFFLPVWSLYCRRPVGLPWDYCGTRDGGGTPVGRRGSLPRTSETWVRGVTAGWVSGERGEDGALVRP